MRAFVSSLIAEGREAWRYRELLGNLVQRELDVRYKNSAFGVLWSLANPIVRALILWAVFEFIVPFNVSNYSAYVLMAFFPWTYFLTGVLDACDSVSRQMPLVRKVYFPRELLPLATTIANLRHFFLSLGVLAVYVGWLYVSDWWRNGPEAQPPPMEILLVPLLILMQTLLIGGIALFLSALNVFFEDIKFITAVLLDLLFYAVPIVYFLEQVQTTDKITGFWKPLIYHLYLLNPMTVILTSYRHFLLAPGKMRSPLTGGNEIDINIGVPWPYFWIAFAVCVFSFIAGYAFFNRRKWRFVEQA